MNREYLSLGNTVILVPGKLNLGHLANISDCDGTLDRSSYLILTNYKVPMKVTKLSRSFIELDYQFKIPNRNGIVELVNDSFENSENELLLLLS